MLILNPKQFERNISAEVVDAFMPFVSRISIIAFGNLCRIVTKQFVKSFRMSDVAEVVTELTYKNIRTGEQHTYRESDHTAIPRKGLVLDVGHVPYGLFLELERLRTGELEESLGHIPENTRVAYRSYGPILKLIGEYIESLSEEDQIRRTKRASLREIIALASEWERVKIKRLAQERPQVTEGRTILVHNHHVTIELLHSESAFVSEGDFMHHCMNKPQHYSPKVLTTYEMVNFHVRTGNEVATIEINVYDLVRSLMLYDKPFNEHLLPSIGMCSGYKNKVPTLELQDVFVDFLTYDVLAEALRIMMGFKHHFAPLVHYEFQAAFMFGIHGSLPKLTQIFHYRSIQTKQGATGGYSYLSSDSVSSDSLKDLALKDMLESLNGVFNYRSSLLAWVPPSILPSVLAQGRPTRSSASPKFSLRVMEPLAFVRNDWNDLDASFSTSKRILTRDADNVILNSLRKPVFKTARWIKTTSGLILPTAMKVRTEPSGVQVAGVTVSEITGFNNNVVNKQSIRIMSELLNDLARGVSFNSPN